MCLETLVCFSVFTNMQCANIHTMGFSSTFFFHSTDIYLQTDYTYGMGTGCWDKTKATMARRVAGTGGPIQRPVIS